MSHDPKPDKENMGPSTTPHNFLKLDQLQILKKKMGSHDSDEKLCSKSMDGKNPLRRFYFTIALRQNTSSRHLMAVGIGLTAMRLTTWS
jgi:hypothetical protein